MRVMSCIKKGGMITYLITIIISILFNLIGLELINTIISTILKILYFIILTCAIVSFYRSKKKNSISIFLFFLPFILLFTEIPFKIVTMILVLPLFFLNGVKTLIGAMGILIYGLLITVGILGRGFEDLGANTVIDQQYSPNGIYRTITIDSDQGALGGDTLVILERMYFGIAKKNIKTLYHGHWGEKPKVIWVDYNTVKINEIDMNIDTSKTWENKNKG